MLLVVSLTSHGPSLVVEVAEDDVDALVLLTQEILNRDFNVVKGDVSSTCRSRVCSLDGGGLDAFLSLDEKHA